LTRLDYRDLSVRDVVVLLTATSTSRTAILDEGRRHERKLTIVLSTSSHMVHYLWLAGFALCHRTAQTDVWMTHHLLMVLSLPVARISSRRSSRPTRRACPRARKPSIRL
jgi:hypothetical protein